MREILFRGKRNQTKKGTWVYGDFCHCAYGNFPTQPSIIPHTEGVWEPFSVYPETVGQWTGLVDKKGNKIFEGDIIDIYYPGCKKHYQYIVLFEDGSFCYQDIFCGYVLSFMDNEINVHYKDVEIVGNIYDNTELPQVDI